MTKKKTGKKAIDVNAALDLAGLSFSIEPSGAYLVDVIVFTGAEFDTLINYLQGLGGVVAREFHIKIQTDGTVPGFDIYALDALDAVANLQMWALEIPPDILELATFDLTDVYAYDNDAIQKDINVGVLGTLQNFQKEKIQLEKDLAEVGKLERELKAKYDKLEAAFASGKKTIENVEKERAKNEAEIKRLKAENAALIKGKKALISNFPVAQSNLTEITLLSEKNKQLTKDKKNAQYLVGKTGSATRMLEAWNRNELANPSKVEKKYGRSFTPQKMPYPLDRDVYRKRMTPLANLYIWLRGEIDAKTQAIRNFQNSIFSGFPNGVLSYSDIECGLYFRLDSRGNLEQTDAAGEPLLKKSP